MASRLEVIRSNKGHHKVIHLGFMYTKHKAMGDKIRWRCVQRGAHCKGSIFTSNDFKEPRVTVNHNHMPDFNAVEFARSRTMFAERLAMFHPLEVELNREGSRVTPTRLKQESYRESNGIGRVKLEPIDCDGYYCPSLDGPSTSSNDHYPSTNYVSPRTTRKSQAPQPPPPPPPKPVQPPPQQQQQQQQQLKRPMLMKPLAPKPRPASPPQPPPPPPEVCLRWNSYHSNMQATFPALLNNEQFVDVTLACEGRSIKCHKMILSACSSYFDELLSQNPCQHPIVLMKDLKFWEVQALVEFMYRGEVNVGQDKLPFLLAAAEALQIKGLASPTSSTPQHDDDSMSLGMDPDYMDDLEVPSPSSSRRSRKRRTIAAIPMQATPPPAPVPVVRSTRLQRSMNHHTPPQPSTSGYLPLPQEPPTRKRKLEGPEFDPGAHLLREIKLEPVDIDASNDADAAELFRITCEPTPAFHPTTNGSDRERDDLAGDVECGNAGANPCPGNSAPETAEELQDDTVEENQEDAPTTVGKLTVKRDLLENATTDVDQAGKNTQANTDVDADQTGNNTRTDTDMDTGKNTWTDTDVDADQTGNNTWTDTDVDSDQTGNNTRTDTDMETEKNTLADRDMDVDQDTTNDSATAGEVNGTIHENGAHDDDVAQDDNDDQQIGTKDSETVDESPPEESSALADNEELTEDPPEPQPSSPLHDAGDKTEAD